MGLGLTGKVVLVTGGSDGLGAALVSTLCSEGARVAFCGRNPDRLKNVAAAISDAGGDVLASRTDVTDSAGPEQFVSTVIDRWERIDGLVNNAGSGAAGPFEQQTQSIWEADIDVKLYGAIRMIRLVLPYMSAGGGGSIINISKHAGSCP